MVARGPRYQAKMAGEKNYFADEPCVRGHTSIRLTKCATCLECRRERERATYKNRYESKIKPRLQKKENLKKAAERMAAIRNSWTEEQKASYREYQKIKSREWRKNNPGHRNALNAKYNADKKKRTPAWADTKKIVEIYNNCPNGFHVDHIIPLRAKNVSGLHVHYNLQYLPAIDNMRKNNRWAQ